MYYRENNVLVNGHKFDWDDFAVWMLDIFAFWMLEQPWSKRKFVILAWFAIASWFKSDLRTIL